MGDSNRMEHVMIANNKRREIASRLRYVANDDLGGMSLQKRLAKELELENTSWRGVLRGIADLIDRPTCNMDVMTTDERADYECSEHIMRCLNCGAEFGYVLYSEDGDVSMDDKPNYCPHCGTRVVSDDD